jgi:hypothetical protein
MIESTLREWDGETVIVRHDRPTGAWIFIAIHSTCLGPATGGTRINSYPNAQAALQDALRLAAGMTYKFAVSDLPYGGGKAVIDVPPGLDPQSRLALLRRHGALIHQLPTSLLAHRPLAEPGRPDRSRHWGYSPAYRSPASRSLKTCPWRGGGCWYRARVVSGGP